MSRGVGALRSAVAGLLFASPLTAFLVAGYAVPAVPPTAWSLAAGVAALLGAALLWQDRRAARWVGWIRGAGTSLALLGGLLALGHLGAGLVVLVPASDFAAVAVAVYSALGLGACALAALALALVRLWWPGDVVE